MAFYLVKCLSMSPVVELLRFTHVFLLTWYFFPNSEPLLPEYRECLTRSLQENMAAIVEGLNEGRGQSVEGQGHLYEFMFSDGCITKEERDDVSKLQNTKDRTRATVVLIKDKDIPVLEKFLKRLKTRNETIYRKVMDAYERNKKSGFKNKHCVLCRLMSRVNVRYIVDMLWSAGIIDDDLFHQVRASSLPAGAQGHFWQHMLNAINGAITKNKLKVISTLNESLCRYHHYDDLALALETHLDGNDSLKCTCNLVNSASNNHPTASHQKDTPIPNPVTSHVVHPKMGLSDKAREASSNKVVQDGLQRRKDARIYINTCDQAILPDKPVIVDSLITFPQPKLASSVTTDSRIVGVSNTSDVTVKTADSSKEMSASTNDATKLTTFGRMERACVSLEDLTSLGTNKGNNSYGDSRNSDGVISQYNVSLDNLLYEKVGKYFEKNKSVFIYNS